MAKQRLPVSEPAAEQESERLAPQNNNPKWSKMVLLGCAAIFGNFVIKLKHRSAGGSGKDRCVNQFRRAS